jgi:AcrR family transcriptional regulator
MPLAPFAAVKRRAAAKTGPRSRASAARPAPKGRPSATLATAQDSKERILNAASAEFALRGFAAAGVDRIAARARLNKAMIYYHFHNKQDLYRTVLRQLFGAIGDRLEALVATSDPAPTKLNQFVDVLVSEGQRHPHFAPIILRELAEGGRRLDEQTYTLMLRLAGAMRSILDEGRTAGQFADIDPILFHMTTMWSIVSYLATEPIRASIARVAHLDVARFDPDRFIRHMQTINQKALALCPSDNPAPAARSARPRQHGDLR